MIPSRTWFPGTLQDRAGWCANLSTQFADNAVALGFTAAQATANTADCTMVVNLAAITVALNAYAEAVRQFRIIITENPTGDPTPIFPDFPSYSSPSGPATGVFERIDNLVKRIRLSPAYTDEIGALLGILPSSPTTLPENELKPVIKASESIMNYKFDVNVTRLGMTQFKIQILRSGDTVWEDVAFATNNPATVAVTPTTAGQPERIQVRAILLASQQPIGIPSDPTYVTVNP